MSEMQPHGWMQAFWHNIADLRDRGAKLWRRAVCRLMGCRWGFWLPTEFRMRGRDEKLDRKSIFEHAVRQCLRCRTLQQGPGYMPYEPRDVQ